MNEDAVRRQVFQDFGERTTTFKLTQDTEPILDQNKHFRTVEQRADWGRHVASIPTVLIAKWLHELWGSGATHVTFASLEFQQFLKKKLDDPEYQYLRTDRPPSAYRR
jgi:hypothetical protein